MNSTEEYTFQEAFDQFAKNALALKKACYLLSKDNIDDLSVEQREEIELLLQEYEQMEHYWFEMLFEKGIPTNMLPPSLQVIV